jgi:iron(III) transport system substrate-binding protein
MANGLRGHCISLWLLLFVLSLAQVSYSAPLPKATQELLKKFKLDPSVLADIDKELEVPKDWLEKAKKEGKMSWRSTPATPDDLKLLFGPFKERYPFIEIEFSGTNQEDRSVKTLVAYKSGKALSDVLSSIAGFIPQYKEVNALEDLRVIPNFKKVPEKAQEPSGLWVGINQNYWCMSYNTKSVAKQELPRKWEDLLTNPKWRGGKLALGNRPQVWALNVWQVKGEKWIKDFLTKLFTELKPQLRREGLNLLPQLVGAGEYLAAIPSNYKRPYQLALDGSPVAFACPEPVPASVEDLVILRGSPHPYAARLFVNWLLSKEGQIAQFAFEYAAPLDKELRPKLLPFADQILGKQESFRDEKFQHEVEPKLFEFWNDLWLRSGGKPGR